MKKNRILFVCLLGLSFPEAGMAALYAGSWNSSTDYSLTETWMETLGGSPYLYLGSVADTYGMNGPIEAYHVTGLTKNSIVSDSGFVGVSGGYEVDITADYLNGQYLGYFGDGVSFGDGNQYSATLNGTVSYTMHFDTAYNYTGVDINNFSIAGTVDQDPSFILTMSGNGHETSRAPGTHSGVYDYTQFDLNLVPIPTAFWLLGSGLLGLVGIRRKISA